MKRWKIYCYPLKSDKGYWFFGIYLGIIYFSGFLNNHQINFGVGLL